MTLATGSAFSADPKIDYLTQIKPILSDKCYSCHGVLKQESALRLETRSLMIEGGDSGAAIEPGKPDESSLLHRVSASDGDRMPPPEEGAALKPDEITLLRAWIQQGAAAPDEEIPLAPQDHWAFQPVQRPADLAGELAHGNPIDALLESKRQAQSLKVQPAAPRSIAIRRLYLDLIGLPPTQEQLRDQRPWEEIVDDLLRSPHHGERWARHWMDIWRYSDWYGLGAQLRYSQKHIWRWRDWIITSLRQDKGYDRMIMEMLAGDELEPNNPEAVTGTGFLARNYYLFNRTTWLDSTIEHTGKAFLGLTLNCAKCHDHKYDPITQVDYYRFRALLEPHQVRLDPIEGVTDFEQDGLPRVFDDHLELETYLHLRGDPKNPDKETKIVPGVPAILDSFAPEIRPITLPYQAYAPGARDYVQRDHLRLARENVQKVESELAAARKTLAELPPQEPQPAAVEGSLELSENFDGPNPELWELVGDGWQFRDGQLHQTQPTRQPFMVRLRKPIPADFDLTCQYTTTGGTTYKSVTFRFDQSEDGKYSNFVYTSAHTPGPKVQVAYSRGGNNAYPPDGRVSNKIEIGKQYQLRFAVRGTLVNVWLDDAMVLAYRLPDRKPDGFFSLSAFDATAAFDSITIRSLPEDISLREAQSEPVPTPTDAETAVKQAEAKLAAAKTRLASLAAVIAADNAKYQSGSDEKARAELARKAARLQAEWSKKQAQFELVGQSDDKKVKAAQARLKKADEKLAAVQQGDDQYQTIRASRKALETPAHKEPDYSATYNKTSSGRRLALAKWVASTENPLTARVAVNHVWTRHFGKPLVESVFDFGLRARRPTHADVLDLLAYEFMASGWSFRHLHRLIVTSEAYRLHSSSAGADAATLRRDPDNQFFWRMNSRRMESQIVRDSLLSLAGALDQKIGGPSIDPKNGGTRRSIYFMHSRDQQDTFLKMFDDADLLQCYRRSESIVPQQALALSNSKLSIEMATKIAARIFDSLGGSAPEPDRQQFIDATFESLLGRLPDPSERTECLRFYQEMEKLLVETDRAQVEQRIRARLVQAILNHNDFVSIR